MADKVIDLDPNKRLNKESLEAIKASVASFTVDSVENILILYTDKEGGANFEAFGVDWFLLGIGQAYLEELRRRMLCDFSSESDS